MFYSQFILAKKGPLGTIWIAAHLERKLRKNQVADTDIGVSVDSILFPEAPIALRLSSHLLLGVVRIYSKKVNYLFNDCSEALLNVKQAFRSTAVDLPPEESRAPYHSITLPETFHLDDFELPDSTYGNFVDHHVSSKEQITLQDSVTSAGCSTSQFGLDERFGDGDASQIGLDLDEDLFLEKDPLPQNASGEMDPGDNEIREGQPSTSTDMDIDKDRHDSDMKYLSALLSNTHNKSSESDRKDVQRHGYNPRTPDLNEVFTPGIGVDVPVGLADDNLPSPDLTEFAHAPSTPGLVEEAIRASFQDNPTLSPQEKTLSDAREPMKPDTPLVSSLENGILKSISTNVPTHDEEAGRESLDVSDANGSVLAANDKNLGHNGEAVDPEITNSNNFIHHEDREKILTSELPTENTEVTDKSLEVGKNSAENSAEPAVSSDQNCVAPNDAALVEHVPGVSIRETSCVTDMAETEVCHIAGSSDDKVVEQSAEAAPKDAHLDQLNCFSSSELPEPEKMLLAPRSDENFPNDLGELTTGKGVMESDGSIDWSKNVASRKRLLSESMPVLEKCSSTKLSGRTRLRRNSDFVPDDDDLLASILVGRKTPALRMEPAPPPSKVASFKRRRLESKAGHPKRKLLIDDAMVLHADTIRQQLINTEDIRRIRKKAPCTRSEIWMIEKSSTEEEIFEEPLFTGLSEELHKLHLRSFPLVSKKKLSESEKGKCIAPTSDNIDAEKQGPSSTSTAADSHTCKDGRSDVQDQDALQIPLSQSNVSGNESVDRDSTVELDQQQVNNAANLENGRQLQDNIGREDLSREQCADQSSENCDVMSGQSRQQLQEDIADTLDVPKERNDKHSCENDTAEIADRDEIANGTLVRAEDTCLDDAEPTSEVRRDDVVEEPANLECFQNSDAVLEDIGEGVVTVSGEMRDDVLDEKDTSAGMVSTEMSHMTLCSIELNVETGTVPSGVGENGELQEFNLDGTMDVEDTPLDFGVARDTSDFCSAIEGNDTDFLNMDEEADFDEADIDVPNAEETQHLENSGWSTRTRGVARYLKLIFDEEYGHGRKVVAVDQLVAGKTRKEASRMFFETLVLKTRDYIDVEQDKPYDFIKIKPRSRLVKSEF